jgi:hypothetical protein
LLGFGDNHKFGVGEAEFAVFTFQHKQTEVSITEKTIMNYEMIYGLMNRRFLRDMKLELPPILENTDLLQNGCKMRYAIEFNEMNTSFL